MKNLRGKDLAAAAVVCANAPDPSECLSKHAKTSELGIYGPQSAEPGTSVLISWDKVEEAENYKLVISRTAACADAEFEIEGIEGLAQTITFSKGGVYYLCMNAYDSKGVLLPYSIDPLVVTVADKESTLVGASKLKIAGDKAGASTDKDGLLWLSWQAGHDAINSIRDYTLLYYDKEGCAGVEGKVPRLKDTSYELKGENGKTYSFLVQTFNSQGVNVVSECSSSMLAQTLNTTTPPVAGSDGLLVSSKITANSITLSWDKATGGEKVEQEVSYLAYWSTSNNIATPPLAEANGTPVGTYRAGITSQKVSGLEPNTEYYFNVVAKDADGNKTSYKTFNQATAPVGGRLTAGTFMESSNIGVSGFTVNWLPASDVTLASSDLRLRYFVCSGASALDIDTAGECVGAQQELGWSVGTTSLNFSNKDSNTTFFYNVVAMDSVGNQVVYPVVSVTTLVDTRNPTINAFKASTGISDAAFTLNWAAGSDNATSTDDLQYFVCSGATMAALDTVAECMAATQEMNWAAGVTSLSILGKSPSTTYHYNVIVRDKSGNKSLYSGKSQVTAADTTAPVVGNFMSSTGVSASAFTLNWSPAIDSISPATSLQYFVCSASSAAAINTLPGCLAATQEMNWTNNVRSLGLTGKAQATVYYYNVAVRDAAGNAALYNGKAQATGADGVPPSAGTFSPSTSIDSTSFTLNWTAASDVGTAAANLQYFVCTGANAAAIDSIAECLAASVEMSWSPNTTSLSINGKAPLTAYYYNVVVKDAVGNEALYEGKSQTTAADTILPTAGSFSPSTGVTNTDFTLNWSAASDNASQATAMQYFVCSGANAAAIDTVAECLASVQEMAWTANVTTLALTGLNAGATYYYNVIAKDEAGNNALYDGKTQMALADTVPPVAGSFAAETAASESGFTLNWSAASDVITTAANLSYYVCSGASAAAIDTLAECAAATQEMAWTANTTSLSISGKLPLTTYHYNVIVRDEASNEALYNGASPATLADTTAPTVGAFSASTSVGDVGFTLNWAAASDSITAAADLQYLVCSGANAAAIDTLAECAAATQEMAWTANTTSLAMTGKTPVTTYYYNVIVKDSAGNQGLYGGKSQATDADTTLPTAGTFAASTGVTDLAFTLNWAAASDNVTAAADLQYFVCSGVSSAAIDTVAECAAASQEMNWTANTTSLALSGKSPSTTYYYNVIVKDQNNNSSLYNGRTQATLADTTQPTAATFSASTGVSDVAFTLNWAAASDAGTPAANLEYFLCSAANAAAIDTTAECLAATQEMAWTANATSLALTGKAPLTTYYYNVVVRDAANNTALYDGISQTTIADTTAPTAGSFAASTGVSDVAFTLNWGAASDNATSAASLQYFVCSGANAAAIDTAAECAAATQEMNWAANTTSLVISGKAPLTTYYYNVVVKDAAGNQSLFNGKAQATLADTTLPTAGTFSASSGVSDVGFTLNWSAGSDNVTAAASLQYFVCSGANASAIDTAAECVAATQAMAWTANTTSLAITAKAPLTTYYYNVVVRDAAGNQSLYDGKAQTTLADTTAPTAGTFSASSAVTDVAFTLNWAAASDNVTAAASLQYFVCSGANAAAIDTTAECLAATAERSWTANSTSLAISGKAPLTTYYYNVVVRDAAGNESLYDGKAESTLADTTAPSAATFSASSSVTATGYTLNWGAASDNVTPAASLLYLVCSGANAAAIDTAAECVAATSEMAWTANTTSLAITGKSPATTYYYNVVVKDDAGNQAVYNGRTQATIADSIQPTAGTFSASTGMTFTSFTLNWSAASDNATAAASLQYFVCSGANAAAIDTASECTAATQEMNWTANTLSLAIAGKASATTYYYNVVVKDAAGNETIYDGKDQATATDVTPPTIGTFSASTSVSDVGFTLNWSAGSDNLTTTANLQYAVCSGANAAAIDTIAECIAATQAMAWTANTTSLAITGKAPLTTYYYNVMVMDDDGNQAIYAGKDQTTMADTTVPTAGAFSASTAVTDVAFTLNWSAGSDNVTAAASLQYFVCSGANAAAIDTAAECVAATQAMDWTANTTSLAVTGKAPLTTYYYNVVVKDAAGNQSVYDGKAQATVADTTLPTAGTFSASSGVTDVAFTLNWSAGSDNVSAAASLQYFVCSGANAAAVDTAAECVAATQAMDWTANTTSLAVTGKAPLTTYYYNVVVKDAAGNQSLYDGKAQATVADTTVPTAGTFSASTSVIATGFTLNWAAASDNVTAAASLQYFVCSGASAASIDTASECVAATQEMGWTANTTSHTIASKSPLTTYYYNVIVRDAAGNQSIYDGKAQATAADTTNPTAGTFSASSSVTYTSFTLNWSAASDNATAAASLQYFVCSGANAAAIDTAAECVAATPELAWTANTTSLALSGKSAATTYYYNVVVRDTAGNQSLYDGKAQATNTDVIAPTAGTFAASTSVSDVAFTLNWGAASDNFTAAASLQYFVCTGANAAAIDTAAECVAATQAMGWTANTTSLAVTGKSPLTTYYYNVVARDAAGNQAIYDGKAQATAADTTLPTAGTFSASSGVSDVAFTLNWSAGSDNITTAASLQYFVCSGANASAIDTAAECVAATQAMAWTANTTSLAISSKTPSTTYYYNVVVQDAAGNQSIYDGKAQATLADTTNPSAATFSASTSVTATGFTLNWAAGSDNVTAAASLQYFVCSGASAIAVDTVAECAAATQEMGWTANTTSLVITGKSPITTYYYNVVVRDAAGNQSLYDGKAQATAADTTAPTAGTLSASSSVTFTSFTLNWSAASDNATAAASLQYFVCSGANAAAIDTAAECVAATQELAWTANTTSLAISGKSAATTYYYNVVVKDAAGNQSLYDGKAQATNTDVTAPTVGTFSASTNVTDVSFRIYWTAASDNLTAAASLEYYVCSGASTVAIDTIAECLAATQELDWTANANSRFLGGRTPSTTYYFNVVVRDAAGNQAIYGGKTQATTADTTAPTAGTFSTSSSVSDTAFTLNWSAGSDTATVAASLQYFVCSAASALAIDTAAECIAATQAMAWTANTTSLAVTGKTPLTTYYYNVVVRDAAGNQSIYDGKAQATLADTTNPSAATFSASTSVTATGFTLNWAAGSDNVTAAASLQYFVCSGASAIAIDTVAECTAATQELGWTANTTSLAISGKSPSTTYFYNVVVRDAAGNQSLYDGKAQATAADTTAPTAGSFSTSTSITATSFTLVWSAASDNVTAAASLQYFVCSGASAVAIDTAAECVAATQEMAWTANTTSLAISGKSPVTTYYYNVVARDAAGNQSIYNGKSQATAADTTPPTAGTFSSTLAITDVDFFIVWSAASDNVTGGASLQYFICSGASAAAIDTAAECLAATQVMAWATNPQIYAITSKSPSTTYYYNVVVKDAAGNQSIYNGTSVTTNAKAIAINSGSAYTNNTSATLNMTVTSATDMYITNVAGCGSGGTWETYAASKAWPLPTANATNTVYAKYRNTTAFISSCRSASIVHDSIVPTSPVLSISSGSDYTTSSSVTIGLSATGADQMLVTNNSDCATGTWETYATTKSGWPLGQTNGTATVYVIYRDFAGNLSAACASDTIVHDSIVPTNPGTFDDGTTTSSNTSSPQMTWVASTDAGSGISYYSIAIGSTPGASDVATWTSVGNSTSAYRTGLALTSGTTYYASIRAFDQAGNPSSVVTGDGFTYSVIWKQQAYIKAANNNSGDEFGMRASIYGETIAVGAPGERSAQTTVTNGTTAAGDNSITGAGAVYIYLRNATAWSQQAYLKPSNLSVSDSFGEGLSLYGDTVAVSAWQEDSNQSTITNGTTSSADNSLSNAGAVTVFQRTGTVWAAQAYIKPANPRGDGAFGQILSLSGDTLAVGTDEDSTSSSTITNGTTADMTHNNQATGAVFVYKRTGTLWAQQAYIKATNVRGFAHFGEGVGLDADTLVVGSHEEDSPQTTITNGTTASTATTATNAGAAYIYKRTGTLWAQEAYLKASNAGAGDMFGSFTAIDGDTVAVAAKVEGSNVTTITNGSTASADNSAAGSGAVYVYKRTGTLWAQEAYIKAANNSTTSVFGTALSLSDDTLTVGAALEDSSATAITNGTTAAANSGSNDSGAAYVYRRTGTIWKQEAYIKAVNNSSLDKFGTFVGIDSNTLVVGSPSESSSDTTITNGTGATANDTNSNSGAVYIYTR